MLETFARLFTTALIVFVTLSVVSSLVLLGYAFDEQGRSVEQEKQIQEEMYNRYEESVGAGYIVMLDGREASKSELNLIHDNFSSYMVGFDDVNKTVSVTKRVVVEERSKPVRIVPFIPVFR